MASAMVAVTHEPARLGLQHAVGAPLAHTTHEKNENLLVVSPYHEEAHLLDLATVDTPNQLLARALGSLEFIRADHRTAPYADAFNWAEVIATVRRLAAEQSDFEWKRTDFYIVAFRSQIPPSTDYSHLGALDKDAHAEATASGGFLKQVTRPRPADRPSTDGDQVQVLDAGCGGPKSGNLHLAQSARCAGGECRAASSHGRHVGREAGMTPFLAAGSEMQC